jgi:hypothetical protein
MTMDFEQEPGMMPDEIEPPMPADTEEDDDAEKEDAGEADGTEAE